jgi:hypothetical protein
LWHVREISWPLGKTGIEFSPKRAALSGQHVAERLDHFSWTIGFGQEAPTRRQVVAVDPDQAGRRDDFDGRPAVFHKSRKLEAIHRSWHLDVGEDDVDVWSRFNNGYGFGGVTCLNRIKSRACDDIDRVHPEQYIVLYHKDNGSFGN